MSVIAHSLSYLAYGKAVTLYGSPARLVLGATTKQKQKNLAVWHKCAIKPKPWTSTTREAIENYCLN